MKISSTPRLSHDWSATLWFGTSNTLRLDNPKDVRMRPGVCPGLQDAAVSCPGAHVTRWIRWITLHCLYSECVLKHSTPVLLTGMLTEPPSGREMHAKG